ncbi:MAG: carotenoid oxygenase family protein [Pseudomonadales bacterium]|nr:carotenoid oxygenase family protein [Pseudomonadales bacterium]
MANNKTVDNDRHSAHPDEEHASATEQVSTSLNRRGFLGGVIATGAVASAGLVGMSNQARAGLQFPKQPPLFGAGGSAAGAVSRSENDLYDCEVEGDLPADLDGAFYRVGPDPQYPKAPDYENDIPFDGEGHVTMWRIKDGHADYRSRYVKNQRWKAQHAARRSLFGMYRNPMTDDPLAAGLSRGTANTQVFYHHGKLLAMKEDSPPVAMDPLTLDTLDDYYTFGGGMKGQTFTAHPKIDAETGEMICFGYEAKGFLTDDVEIFSVEPLGGRVTWSAWIKVPYACMIHDFSVTATHIGFLITPLAANRQIIEAGGPHFAWDSTLPSWMGVMHRGGDGSDIRWFKGPGEMATHTMGTWSDGEKFYWDVDGGESNQFPFFPQLHERFDPVKAVGRVRRMTVDLNNRRQQAYDIQFMYPEVTGVLARQDDRYHTVPYRYGFLQAGAQGWAIMDHQAGTHKFFSQPDTQLAEMCFVPRRQNAPEGDGYLIGVANRLKENGRSDLILIDAQHPEDGVIATVKMPYKVPGQVHGFWVNGYQLPRA